jgi:hypothetical protein
MGRPKALSEDDLAAARALLRDPDISNDQASHPNGDLNLTSLIKRFIIWSNGRNF